MSAVGVSEAGWWFKASLVSMDVRVVPEVVTPMEGSVFLFTAIPLTLSTPARAVYSSFAIWPKDKQAVKLR